MYLEKKFCYDKIFACDIESFQRLLNALKIWISKPNCVNKRLCGSKIVHYAIEDKLEVVKDVVSMYCSIHSSINYCDNTESIVDAPVEISSVLMQLNVKQTNYVVIIREMISKQIKVFPSMLEAIIYGEHF